MNQSKQTEENMKLATRIYNENSETIRRIIRRQVNDPTTVDDILHDFFLSLIRKPIPNEIENIKGYLYQAIRHDILDAAARKKNYNARLTRYAQRKIYENKSSNPQKIALKKDEIQKIFDLINNQLPPREAMAVLQRYLYDLNTTQAAKAMNIDKRSFSRYICVGLKKIRQAVTS